jgi:hypothetical protein
MDAALNPYAPGAGTPPPELSGRQDLLEQVRIALARTRLGRPAKGFFAVGLRGVGKTVLLREALAMAASQGFYTCFVEADGQKSLSELLVPHLRRLLLDLDRLGKLAAEVKRGLRVMKSFLSGLKLTYGDAELALDIDPELGAGDSGDLEDDLSELFSAIGRAAAARKISVALFIDEVQYFNHRDLAALIKALNRCAQETLPIILIGAGLPQMVGLAGRAKSYAERMFDFPALEALGRTDADRAVLGPAEEQNVEVTRDGLDAIDAAAHGYPYFIQEWAYHAWNAAPGPKIDRDVVLAASPAASRRLDDSFFRVRFDRLTPREKQYLRAMASLGAGVWRAGDIAERLGVKPPSVAPLRNGLIAKGMIFSPRFGETAFTVPMFDDFLRRAMPDWVSPSPNAMMVRRNTISIAGPGTDHG